MGPVDEDRGFQLEERKDKTNVGIHLLSEGFMQAYIDFFYLTNETTPSCIEPSDRLMEEKNLNKHMKQTLDQTPENLVEISETLKNGEIYWREQAARECFKTYQGMAQMYVGFNDYETASYFHQRCLDISIEFKYIEGEAQAHRGLGICEEKVFNKFPAMQHLETAMEKAKTGELLKVVREISKDLVRVYQMIANEYLERNEFDMSLQFFEKCLGVAQEAQDRDIEAECYQQIGMIYETQGELDRAVEQRELFLDLCKDTGNRAKQIEAHKLLAETYSKSDDQATGTSKAIKHLMEVLNLCHEEPSMEEPQSEATLKLGLLHYKPGPKHSIKHSGDYLATHFSLIRHGEKKNSRQIDLARVNLGIVRANQQLDNYKYMITNPKKL